MKWIVRASSDGVCFCTCDEGIARLPGVDQLDCPWCGCGWLFMCAKCDVAFTYGRIAEIYMLPTEIATRMVENTFGPRFGIDKPRRRHGIIESLRGRIAQQSAMLGDVGEEVVVIDGRVLPLDHHARSPVNFIGRTGVHRMERLPQFETRDPDKLSEMFAQPYWLSLDRALYQS